MEIELISAEDLRFNADGTIDMMAVFSHLGDQAVPFTASQTDSMEHGRAIHAAALAGELGEVAAYVAPSELEIAQREAPKRLAAEMKRATDEATGAWMINDLVMADEWRAYYAELLALEISAEWPLVAQWPEAPQ